MLAFFCILHSVVIKSPIGWLVVRPNSFGLFLYLRAMKKIHLYLLLSLCLLSCRTTKKTTHTVETYQSQIDSLTALKSKVITDTIYRDRTEVIVDKIESIVKVPINCDSLGRVNPIRYKSQSGIASAEVDIKDNNIEISIKVDSIVSYYENFYRSKFVKDSIHLIEKFKQEKQLKTVTESKTVKYRMSWIYIVIIIIILIVLMYFLGRKFRIL